MSRVIHWFRRDLRLTDNTALAAAADSAEEVITVYIVSGWKGQHHWTGPNRQGFLCECLRLLADDLKAIGGRLIIRSGPAEKALEKLIEETGAEAFYFNRDPDPFGRGVEDQVEKMAGRRGVKILSHQDVTMRERDEVLSGSGKPYRVYSPYFNAWDKLERRAPGPKLKRLKTPKGIASDPLPTLAHWGLQPSGAKIIAPGETAARKRLDVFFKKLAPEYVTAREHVGDATSSRLSQDLRWGLISIRDLLARSREMGGASIAKFTREVAWRDFYMQILFHFPQVLDCEFNPAMRGLPWESAKGEKFRRWCDGQTGFPIVDAGMRQLNECGFMHNRLRIIVSMFLTKDLRIDWRAGEAFFMRQLVDGEIANNNGNWQWSAGVGADAAPYFRIQNPWTQSANHDPDGAFIREYIPELRDVPTEKLHAAPDACGSLAKGYPAPMLDHKVERARTLEVFKRHLKKPGT